MTSESRSYLILELTTALGTLGLALLPGAILLGTSGMLFSARQGLEVAPVFGVFLACVFGSVTVGALAMTASLWLPRTVTALLVFGTVWTVGVLETAVRLAVESALAKLDLPSRTDIAALNRYLDRIAIATEKLAKLP